MNYRLFFLGLLSLLSMSATHLLAQTSRVQRVKVPKDSLYRQTIDYLREHEFCIDCVDCQLGFVKAKKYVENDKLLSTSIGKRIELSIFVSPVDDAQSSLSLSIYCISLDKNPAFHQEGMCKDEKIYQSLIQGIISTE